MCYNVAYLTKRKLDYAKRIGANPEEISELEKEYEKWREAEGLPTFYVSAFAHPLVPVVSNAQSKEVEFYEWGLIPFWANDVKKTVQIQNKTGNARGETIFEKPSFKSSAKSKRCLVLVDGFYEYHTLNGKKYPFYIQLKNKEPFTMAGLWEHSRFDDISKHTFSIVTCSANSLMAQVHNKPAASDTARMPLILPKELQFDWLKPINDELDQKAIQELIQPYDAEEMMAHTVGKLSGKESNGNSVKAMEPFTYEELGVAF